MQSAPQRFSDGSCVGVFSDGLCVEVSVPISLPVAFPLSIPVGPGDDGRGLCVELVLPIRSAVGSTPPLYWSERKRLRQRHTGDFGPPPEDDLQWPPVPQASARSFTPISFC